MNFICQIIESEDVVCFLKKRSLVNQYKKAKSYLLDGRFSTVKFSERNPKGSGIWYFRINRQFRAFAVFDDDGV